MKAKSETKERKREGEAVALLRVVLRCVFLLLQIDNLCVMTFVRSYVLSCSFRQHIVVLCYTHFNTER